MKESIDRYGIDAYFGAIRYSCDVSADAMRDAITTKIPYGVYESEDGVDADGVDDSLEYKLKMKLTKIGHKIEVDFSGASAQARASINCGPLDVKGAVGVALKMLIEQKAPLSRGCFCDIDIVIPPGTFCSATPPDGPIFMYWEASITLLIAIYRALADALGKDAIGGDYGSLMLHNGNGITKTVVPWLTVGSCGGEHGPWGGTKVGDGDSYTVFHVSNNIDPASEAVESDTPVVVMRKEYVADTAGPGANRGGAAVRRDTYWLSDGEPLAIALHAKEPSGIGVYGGQAGATQAGWMFTPDIYDTAKEKRSLPIDDGIYAKSIPVSGVLDPRIKTIDANGECAYYASRQSWRAPIGTTFRLQTGGGGGWGNPLERDPKRMMRDVRDEYVSIEGALRDYGVVITGDPINDPEGLKIDSKATADARKNAHFKPHS